MQKVPLDKGKFALVDDEDFERVSKLRWHYWVAPGKNRLTPSNYAVSCINRKGIHLHRFVMNAQKGQYVDHKNRDGLDCRKENLRFCTPAQNRANSIGRARRKAKYKGVFPMSKTRWIATISINRKTVYLGGFKDQESAARAYDAKAREVYGEFAVTNFK